MVYRRLTDRQGEVLRLICDGRTVQEIADALGVTVLTVKIHRQNIRQRFNQCSVAELCRMVDEDDDSLAPKAENGGLFSSARYRLEHHRDGQAPHVLGLFLSHPTASAALLREARRLAVNGASGSVMLIDQGMMPDVVVAQRNVAT